jgi:CBS-domain-containing membrane protein
MDSELPASVPKRLSFVAIPDALWGPAAVVALVGVVALASIAAGRPLLFPSLGPSAYLVAENPAHPTSRALNVVVGHLIGVGAAILALLAFGPGGPASVLGIFLLIASAPFVRASHPPAAATTLLLTLGILKGVENVIALLVGVVIVAAVGELLRRVRLRQLPMAPQPRSATEA